MTEVAPASASVPASAFERFYEENYSSLPGWVNEEMFKEDLRAQFMDAWRSDKTFSVYPLLHPLTGDMAEVSDVVNEFGQAEEGVNWMTFYYVSGDNRDLELINTVLQDDKPVRCNLVTGGPGPFNRTLTLKGTNDNIYRLVSDFEVVLYDIGLDNLLDEMDLLVQSTDWDETYRAMWENDDF